MEKLNELVELAKKATSGKWIADSGEGWDAIISQQDMVNGNFIISEFIGPDSKANKDFVLAASPENILAIAEAFRALEQRAEAAEADNRKLLKTIYEEKGVALRIVDKLHAAEAKLAELEKQEPVAYTGAEELKVMQQGTYADMFTPHDSYKSDPQWIPLFIRPAPAINLAELVPREIEITVTEGVRHGLVNGSICNPHRADGWNACVAAILRNIEELVPAEWTLARAVKFVDEYAPPSEEEAALFAANSFRASILRNLAELVPVAIPKNVFNVIYDECGGFVGTATNAQHIWEYCRTAILHNIEEAK
ncbi:MULTISPECIES: hypothetical protein [unclassified Pantoea]|uniref:hypothetical protein n=1 Tax=unclassified Pantoea TaxID=2630326 RepID=UPI0012320614|nr:MULTISPECIES: hypothetical protein [unclassified Pantoea]KAA5932363.1 hypothetical protein F3I59_04865 [Pantoea sp. VH_8]KAA5937424.1 hypothetical protein F3I58_04895 [Pantoea sp. VH_4]